MTKIQKIYLLLFVLFLAAIPVWLFWVTPELLKLPGDYQFNVDLHSTEQTRYDIGAPLTGVALLKGFINLHATESESDVLDVEGLFHIEYLDGTLSYESPEKFSIDRRTRLRKDGDADGYVMFPPKLNKRDMSLYFPGWIKPLAMRFQGEEVVRGLPVYTYVTDIVNDDISSSFEFLDLVPETYNAVVDNHGVYWVEPVSGKLVNYSESGVDYYTDKQSGERIQEFSKYTNTFSDDTIANQVRIAQNEKQKIHLFERWIPILLGLISLAFLIALFASRKVALKSETSV